MNIYFHADDFGRSPNISRDILDVIKNGFVNSVSVMVDEITDEHKELYKEKNIKIKLHLNITEKKYFLKKKLKVKTKQFNFFTLFFASNKWREVIKNDIDKQIQTYISFFKFKELRIDGHEHAHIVPWVYTYILNQGNIKVAEIRYPKESLFFVNYKFLINLHFLRNLFLTLMLRILFNVINFKKINPPEFYGLLYSSLYNKKVLNKNIEQCKKKKQNVEILFHPGKASQAEKKYFNKKYYKFYISNQRNLEKNILKNKLEIT